MLPDYSEVPEATGTTTYSWWEAWNTALRRPSVEAYESLLDDPAAGLRRAVVWLLTASLVAYGLTGVLQAAYFQMATRPELLSSLAQVEGIDPELLSAIVNNVWLAVLCIVPLMCVAFVAGQLIYAGALHFALSAFGGQGTYADLVYAIAAYTAPVTLVSTLLGFIPCVQIVTLPLGIYSVVLHFLAAKAASRLSWGATTASVMIIGLLFMLISAVAVLAIAAPVMENLPSLFSTFPDSFSY